MKLAQLHRSGMGDPFLTPQKRIVTADDVCQRALR